MRTLLTAVVLVPLGVLILLFALANRQWITVSLDPFAAQNPHLYQRDVENIVNAILGEIIAALARGDRVELRGFGAFSVKHRPARTGRNPRTGAHVSVERKSVPFFKTGKEMRERLNRDD